MKGDIKWQQPLCYEPFPSDNPNGYQVCTLLYWPILGGKRSGQKGESWLIPTSGSSLGFLLPIPWLCLLWEKPTVFNALQINIFLLPAPILPLPTHPWNTTNADVTKLCCKCESLQDAFECWCPLALVKHEDEIEIKLDLPPSQACKGDELVSKLPLY